MQLDEIIVPQGSAILSNAEEQEGLLPQTVSPEKSATMKQPSQGAEPLPGAAQSSALDAVLESPAGDNETLAVGEREEPPRTESAVDLPESAGKTPLEPTMAVPQDRAGDTRSAASQLRSLMSSQPDSPSSQDSIGSCHVPSPRDCQPIMPSPGKETAKQSKSASCIQGPIASKPNNQRNLQPRIKVCLNSLWLVWSHARQQSPAWRLARYWISEVVSS